jgi:protein SCO1/2
MTAPARKLSFTGVLGVLLLGVTLALLFLIVTVKQRRGSASGLPRYGEVPAFMLTNQLGTAITREDLRGRVWVADIIFTRCPGPCLRMTRQMKELAEALPPSTKVRLVSLTTDPEFDTPPVLESYAQRFGAERHPNWMFLTGTKQQIAGLSVNGLKLAAVETAPEDRQSPEDLFIHSTLFVVVDKRGQLRGTFETGGEGVEWAESKQAILEAVKKLERDR